MAIAISLKHRRESSPYEHALVATNSSNSRSFTRLALLAKLATKSSQKIGLNAIPNERKNMRRKARKNIDTKKNLNLQVLNDF
jgi:hypothetical protein